MSILASVWPCGTDREHGIYSRRIGELGTHGAPALSWYVCQSGLDHEVEAISFVRHAVRVPLGVISKVALRSGVVEALSGLDQHVQAHQQPDRFLPPLIINE